ncbi:uncharacterized protein LOC121752841 [Salvia splendens]|uniref:uncharacterized protein LOC121752841 n=1 Tax=Salvia splendens TaxID=180675 RepID=UPI001C252021|nr:uncharacterized protein LOC121752841 [Salvia splendens]
MDDFVEAIIEFFHTGRLLKSLNTTIIALIPKTNNNPKVGDFRPIVYCNVVYKAITKIISKRMESLLPKLVNQAQSAFVSGRSIMDNIHLETELMRFYDRAGGVPRCTIKIDLRKAYYTINWEFLEDVLLGLNFHSIFIERIMECVTCPSSSIIMNGSAHGFFKGRLELIRAYLQGAEAYWLQAFLIVGTVTTRLVAIARQFLWGSKFSKVAWKDVCLPREEGGLGLRDLDSWNTALHVKILWNIFAKKDTLWIQWVHTEIVRAEIQLGLDDLSETIRNFVVLETPADSSNIHAACIPDEISSPVGPNVQGLPAYLAWLKRAVHFEIDPIYQKEDIALVKYALSTSYSTQRILHLSPVDGAWNPK